MLTGSLSNLFLVFISYCVAVLASYTASFVDLSGRIATVNDNVLPPFGIAGGLQVAMGIGIWSMHFGREWPGLSPLRSPWANESDHHSASLALAILGFGFALWMSPRARLP